MTKEELRDPEVFRDAISRMPGYDPDYTFERTIHIRLERIPILGKSLRRVLDRLAPGWEEAINWAYFPENPSLWLIFVSIPLLLLGILANLMVNRYGRKRQGIKLHGVSSVTDAGARPPVSIGITNHVRNLWSNRQHGS